MRHDRLARACAVGALFAISFACSGGGGGGSTSPTAPVPVAPVVNASATADYRVTFEATWSAATHPSNIPSNPHFSPLIGATHPEGTRFWEMGGTASDGIKAMAETGSTSPLDSEINQAISQGRAESLLRGGPIARSPGSVKLGFQASLDNAYVTLVSMVAPSPDWFVGVSGLSLMENGDWADRIDVELFAYDAGTDGGKTYTARDQPLNPRQAIGRIQTMPFRVNGNLVPVGTFTFRRMQ